MPTAIVLCGPPGCGKTTFRHSYLANRFVVSTDDILFRYAAKNGVSYHDAFTAHMPTAQILFNSYLDELKDNKIDFVIDRTNLTVKSRKKTLNKLSGVTKIAVYFPALSYEELKERIRKRAMETTQDIPDHVIKSMLECYTIPTIDEGWDYVYSVEEFKEWLLD